MIIVQFALSGWQVACIAAVMAVFYPVPNETSEENERQTEIKRLVDLVTSARSPRLQEAYETKLEALLAESEKTPNIERDADLSIPYRTAFDKATTLLKNPHSVWEKVPVTEKHRLYLFLFDGKISYSRENGYRTADVTSFSSLFQDFLQQQQVLKKILYLAQVMKWLLQEPELKEN